MRIGYILSDFSPLPESFIRREVLALCERGHEVTVYTGRVYNDPLAPPPEHPKLSVRHVPFSANLDELVAAAGDDSVEHLHGSLTIESHFAAFSVARRLVVPFTITAYSGHSIFTAQDPQLYETLSRDPLCGGIIVEDPFMLDWLVGRLGADPAKIETIANSIDIHTYRLDGERASGKMVQILAIARFVEKKGLIHLVEAFRILRRRQPDVELRIIGGGPEADRLKSAAGDDPAIRFLGYTTEQECRQCYRDCDVFCLPCVRATDGDADGVPTTILEAMAFELPVVTSDLLSMPHYVRHEQEGLLALPGDAEGIAAHLERLCGDPELRLRLGHAGRRRAVELCDIQRNIVRLEDLLVRTRRRRWLQCQEILEQRRSTYDGNRLDFYDEQRAKAAHFFAPHGRFLDLGCGDGDLRYFVDGNAGYYGCDPVTPPSRPRFPFVCAAGEALPFADGSFDTLLLKDVLAYALDIDLVLRECARVLALNGLLFLHESVNDPNPVHLNHSSSRVLRSRLARVFEVLDFRFDDVPMKALIVARNKDAGTTVCAPLVSVAITAYNREKYIRRAVRSVLEQSYKEIEVIVVDDGSTDGTVEALAEFNSRIRVIRHDQNQGSAAAKNRAMKETSPQARYVSILDSDDYLDPHFAQRCVAYLESHRAVGVAFVDQSLVDEEERFIQYATTGQPWNLEFWLRTRHLQGGGWMARRDLVMECDPQDPRLAPDEDYGLFYQLLERTDFGHVEEALHNIRLHQGQMSEERITMARCHAANLVKYGYSPEYAYLRAQNNPEWIPAIEEGIALGKRLRQKRDHRKMQGGALDAAEQLAVDGGTPVRAESLIFGQPLIEQDDIDEVVATLRSRWIGTGPRVARFEREFAEWVGAANAVAMNSCTAGLFLNLVTLGIGPGDEVITTPLTFAATANVIEHTGARPIFADIDPLTLNIDPGAIERVITPRTRAILPVHFGGMPCDLEAIESVARRHGIPVIEDAAQAAGARYRGRMIGGGSNAAVFSFYANKNLTTGEGGMVTTSDGDLADRLRLLRSHGVTAGAWERFSANCDVIPDLVAAGYKFNMPDLAAALGLTQLRKQEQWLQTRERYARRYDQAFRDLPLTPQSRVPAGDGGRHSLHLYVVRLSDGAWTAGRDQVVLALRAENIGATVHYRPLHLSTYYRGKYGFAEGSLPAAEQASQNILTLPLSPAMTESDVEDVIEAVRKVAAAYARR